MVPTLPDQGLATRSAQACERSTWPGTDGVDDTFCSIASLDNKLSKWVVSCMTQWNCVVMWHFLRTRETINSVQCRLPTRGGRRPRGGPSSCGSHGLPCVRRAFSSTLTQELHDVGLR